MDKLIDLSEIDTFFESFILKNKNAEWEGPNLGSSQIYKRKEIKD